MKAMSSVDVAAMVQELQSLVGGKVSQIYHPNTTTLILQCHAKGKVFVKAIAGSGMFIAQKKESTPAPTSFCMQLRKYIGNAVISAIEQKDSERIIIFHLEKKEKFKLIFEIFSRGNIVLTNEELTIVGVLERRTWKDRTITHKQAYVFPQVQHNWKTVTSTQLKNILQEDEKKNISTSLATSLGLGGQYAKEVCLRSNVDPQSELKDITTKQINDLHKGLKELRSALITPKGFLYGKAIAPFALQAKEPTQEFATLSLALESLQEVLVISPYKKKLAALKRTLDKQQEAIAKQEENIEVYSKKGELIYEKYDQLLALTEHVNTLKKSKTWQELKELLLENKNITKVDLKTKKITIKL